ncbi:MAG: hypothetical protein A4E40_00700 [Methanoregulaceae archaeon PtaU1.Bin059]|nr:MAG: hypothetical protein A4E40_00700 [Methanoregulaceae archaeon PtaU1.Bin059]
MADPCTLNGVLRREITVSRDFDERNGRDRRVPSLCLEVPERDVIEWCVCGDAHHHSARHGRIHELGGEYWHRAAQGVAHHLVDEGGAGNLGNDGHFVILECELLRGLPADNPGNPVHAGLHIGDIRVHPQVRHPIYGLGPECGSRDERVTPLEHDQGELQDLGLVPLEKVMVPHRVVALRAEPHRVCSLVHVPALVQVQPLPFDELAVLRIDSREATPPVDREAACGHHSPVLLGEVAHDLQGISESLQRLRRDPVKITIQADGLLVASRNPF